jgi:hypothetical protein
VGRTQAHVGVARVGTDVYSIDGHQIENLLRTVVSSHPASTSPGSTEGISAAADTISMVVLSPDKLRIQSAIKPQGNALEQNNQRAGAGDNGPHNRSRADVVLAAEPFL